MNIIAKLRHMQKCAQIQAAAFQACGNEKEEKEMREEALKCEFDALWWEEYFSSKPF